MALAGLPKPLLLDEWQEVPEVLGAIKRSVDLDRTPGSFILTGSVRVDDAAQTWPATGRVVRLVTLPMTQREILGRLPGRLFVDRVITEQVGGLEPPPGARMGLKDYLTAALMGGFPDVVLNLDAFGREVWLQGYIDQLVSDDAPLLRRRVDPFGFAAFVEAFAVASAAVTLASTLGRAAVIDPRTARAYLELLTRLLVADQVPAWRSNRLSEVSAAKKLYLTDSGLLAAVTNADMSVLLQDGRLVGQLVETFVVQQIRAEAQMSSSRVNLRHLRNRGGHREVDLILDYGKGRGVVGVAIKATSAPHRDDAKHLMWLREKIGSAFHLGVVLHTGSELIELDQKILAAPISTLWA